MLKLERINLFSSTENGGKNEEDCFTFTRPDADIVGFSLAGCSDKSDGEGEGLTVCVVVSSAFGMQVVQRLG